MTRAAVVLVAMLCWFLLTSWVASIAIPACPAAAPETKNPAGAGSSDFGGDATAL